MTPAPPAPRDPFDVPLWKIALAVTPGILFAFVAGFLVGLGVACP